MVNKTFFMSDKEARQYLAHASLRAISPEVAADTLLYANSYYKNLRRGSYSEEALKKISSAVQENDFVKMLFHHWSIDPMFLGRPQRIAQIESAQKMAIQMLLSGYPSVEVMYYFVKKSAIAYEFRLMVP
jgi:hypothetical protein